MNADLEHLIIVQAQDLELRRLRQQLSEGPLQVKAAEAACAHAEAALKAAKDSLAREETLRRSQELEVKERQTKAARLRKQMETATSASQIAALEHEIAFLDQSIAKLEDEELASLERTEGFELALGRATLTLEAETTTLASIRVRAADLATRNTAAIASIEGERAATRALLAASPTGEASLSAYDRIAKAKGTGLSEAVDHKCSACQMMVRPQRWNDLTDRDPNSEHANTIFTCETCGRMLYYDPRRDAPVRWTPGERLSSASNP